MLLETCKDEKIEFDFSNAKTTDPGVLNIRLTDTTSRSANDDANFKVQQAMPAHCNTSPLGLFAFSMTIGLQSASLLGQLVPNTVDSSFILAWGPYAFFVSGLLQLIVGMFESTRNNIFGATAFMAFGCFWLSNGINLIFLGYFPADIPEEYSDSDPGGSFILSIFICGFVCVLFKQTLTMNKLTSILIALLALMTFAGSFAGWSKAFVWIEMIFGWMTALFSFFMYMAELSNEIFQKEVFHMYPWQVDSSGETFGAAGRGNTLQSRAALLRFAHREAKAQEAKSVEVSLLTAQPQSKSMGHMSGTGISAGFDS